MNKLVICGIALCLGSAAYAQQDASAQLNQAISVGHATYEMATGTLILGEGTEDKRVVAITCFTNTDTTPQGYYSTADGIPKNRATHNWASSDRTAKEQSCERVDSRKSRSSRS